MAGAPPALIRPAGPARYRGLRFHCGRAGARPSLINSDAVVRLPGPQFGSVCDDLEMARYANWHSDQAESLMSVGSNPTRATGRRMRRVNATSRGPTATTPLLQRGNGGSIPSGTTGLIDDRDDGPRVCRRHPSFVRRGTEFDSRADLWDSGRMKGHWSNGKTPGLQPGDRGSTPRRSTDGIRSDSSRAGRSSSGSSPNGRAPPWRGGDPGSTPGGSTVVGR